MTMRKFIETLAKISEFTYGSTVGFRLKMALSLHVPVYTVYMYIILKWAAVLSDSRTRVYFWLRCGEISEFDRPLVCIESSVVPSQDVITTS